MYNQPHISWSSSDVTMSNKALFRTLVRTFGPMEVAGTAVLEIMDTFNWKRVGVMSYDYGETILYINFNVPNSVLFVCYSQFRN